MKLFFCLFVLVVLGVGCARSPDVGLTASPAVCISDRCVSVTVADDDPERAKGLMFVETLPAGSGMLFVFPEAGFFQFRMKNTLLPLDMLRLDASGVIVHIEHAVPPCERDPCPLYGPQEGVFAKYVLEVGSGVVDKNDRAIGMMAEIRQ